MYVYIYSQPIYIYIHVPKKTYMRICHICNNIYLYTYV